MRHKQNERITSDRKKIEGEEGAPMSPAVDEKTAGIRVDRAEQSPEGIEQANDENRSAEDLKIFRDEPDPEFFARANHERRDEQDDEIALESEKFSGAFPEAHDRAIMLSKLRDDN
jgi:hypothetical protein